MFLKEMMKNKFCGVPGIFSAVHKNLPPLDEFTLRGFAVLPVIPQHYEMALKVHEQLRARETIKTSTLSSTSSDKKKTEIAGISVLFMLPQQQSIH